MDNLQERAARSVPAVEQSLTEAVSTLETASGNVRDRLMLIIDKLKPTSAAPTGPQGERVGALPPLPIMAATANRNIKACFEAADEIESILFG